MAVEVFENRCRGTKNPSQEEGEILGHFPLKSQGRPATLQYRNKWKSNHSFIVLRKQGKNELNRCR